ncbi:hypothetical protein GCM10010218_37200 [Streptomyces mashuensis]|uniref:Uncharacterized protein n=1 Tax=Streptomyces mashuensis TaxID=33904 RepID=A0A919B483_9ACTN|nr:hypothetical protein GCM10010218_37200 [Streptomyces mashuensis]
MRAAVAAGGTVGCAVGRPVGAVVGIAALRAPVGRSVDADDAGPGGPGRTGHRTGRIRPVAALESLSWGNDTSRGETVTCGQ